jgi:hypothetical protein
MPAKKDDKGGPRSADQAQENAADIPQESETPVVKDQIQLKSQTGTSLAQSQTSGSTPGGGSGTNGDTEPPTTNIRGSIDTATTMRRTASPFTNDLLLWVVIRKTTENISFANYNVFMEKVLCNGQVNGGSTFDRLRDRRFLPYNDTDAYRLLKVATEAFLIVNCGVALGDFIDIFNNDANGAELLREFRNLSIEGDLQQFGNKWEEFLEPILLKRINGTTDKTLPYLARIREKLRDVDITDLALLEGDKDAVGLPDLPAGCFNILRRKFTEPCLLELIWSYWHEEGMLAQTLNAISLRFQNVRGPGQIDPLAMMEIDPLRPLNNLIWGYIQDEQHRLSVLRRLYEYDHHYGLSLYGKAIPEIRPADSRSKFLEAFHNLLYLTAIFYKEDDDTTVVADGFPILHALKEVHFLLAEGAHNQFGDLPSTARQEMLLQQWILARTEFREFLPTRIMVAYPEPWMDRVDAMKTLQGWTDTSVLHFRNLGIFGERILLSIRFGDWGSIEDPVQARNWARFWRAEIQGYIHAYRAVTGVDLTAELTDSQQAHARYLQPSFHLRQRLAAQRQRGLPPPQGRMLGTGANTGVRSDQLAVPKRTR